jgi:glycine hydroxymethyltransferase
MENSKIYNFIKQSIINSNRPFLPATSHKDLIDIPAFYENPSAFWYARDNDTCAIIATIALLIVKDDSHVGEIKRFYVHENYQNQGIGTKLLDILIKYAQINGLIKLWTSTMPYYDSAIRVFENYNFQLRSKYNENSSAKVFYELCFTSYENQLKKKLEVVELNMRQSLILNPTENFPILNNINLNISKELQGLYISDDFRNQDSKVIFGGREDYTNLLHLIINKWRVLLKAAAISMRPLSGLHAHTLIFMSIGNIGDKILLLSEKAGGHFSTKSILERLGLIVIEIPTDIKNHSIDTIKAKELIETAKPKFLFIDRSEGLYYEDFTWIKEYSNIYKIFDASQYLTQIIFDELYTHPFDMGFDLIITTLHKNFPGPQKAIVATKVKDTNWNKITSSFGTYVSNMHPEAIIESGAALMDLEYLKKYSTLMMDISQKFETELANSNLPVIQKRTNLVPTQHIWIQSQNKKDAYTFFKKLENVKLYTNYRLLPYDQGYGLRLGVACAIRTGLREKHLPELAQLIADIYYSNDNNLSLKDRSTKIIKEIHETPSL